MMRAKEKTMWRNPPVDLVTLPCEPGVYRMIDGERKVLYVGKARNLNRRISSYFQRQPESPRTVAMVRQIRDLNFSITSSETEALILEHNLIKQLKPRYNVLLKDSKSYPYILLTGEFWPRLRLYRGNRGEPGKYFGPFPDAGAVHQTLHMMQKIFRIRDCENAVFNHRSRPCMQYQIGRCSAPCCNLVSKAVYVRQVEDTRTFLAGRNTNLIRQWEEEMQRASDCRNYELAASLRDRIRALRSVLAGSGSDRLPGHADAIVLIRHATGVVASIGVRRAGRNLGTHSVRIDQAEGADDLEILQSFFIERYRREEPPRHVLINASESDMSELQHVLSLLGPQTRSRLLCPKRGSRLQWLNHVMRAGEQVLTSHRQCHQQAAFEALAELLSLDETPQSIAAVDNAHLGGKQTVAAITYAGWDGSDKAHYRRYKLDDAPAGDDYAAMRIVLARFFRAISEGTIPCPDIMLIDGGRGQLNIAMNCAAECGLHELKLMGVAKGSSRKPGEETLWPAWTPEPLKPGCHSPALLLIARVRDEAHRFAGSYMRTRKKKSMFTSQLEGISGIGPARRSALLKYFGGIEGVKKASRDQLAQAAGIAGIYADRIFATLHR